MYITFYTFYPMQDEMRQKFELPAFPYTQNEAHYKLFENYLKEHKIFHYQDDIISYRGQITAHPIVLPIKVEEGKSFNAFRFEAVLDDKTFKVKDFPPAFMRNPNNHIIKVNKSYGDTKAWFQYNIPGSVSFLDTSGKIKFEPMQELIQQNCEPKCTKK